jgi:hypothetical protein
MSAGENARSRLDWRDRVMKKVECEIVIKEHTVSQLGTAEVQEKIDLPWYPNGYDNATASVSGILNIHNQGDLLFHVGDRIRVTVEKLEG